MDSGNSGSLQSSSGGDDEFDSRGGGGVDSSPLSALLRPAPAPSSAAFSLHGSLYGLQEFAPPQQQPHQAGLWSGAASGSFTGAAGASSSSSQRVAGTDQGGARHQQQAETSAAMAQGSAPPPQQPPRGSRKRTRASRRAPTTVLTTDTSNFRAMVQEFTGIPSPPFAAAPAAALRTRFDHIFPSPSSSLLRSAAAGGSGDASASLPPYLLRPFAQKLPSAPSAFPPFTSASSSPLSSSSIGVASANAATGGATTASRPSSSNPTTSQAVGGGADTFQLTSSALLRLQDPTSYLSFQNLLDSQASSHSIFGAAAGGFARLHEPVPSPSSEFLAGIGGSGNLGLAHGGLMGSEGLHLHHPRSDVQHGGDELSGVVASGGSCKLNYSTHAGGAATTSSAAAASGDKPPDGGVPGPARPARGEGLDAWICTSE